MESAVKDLNLPCVSPAKFSYEFLTSSTEIGRTVGERFVDVFTAHNTAAHLQAFLEELLVELIILGV
jgi:hypothetical protein